MISVELVVFSYLPVVDEIENFTQVMKDVCTHSPLFATYDGKAEKDGIGLSQF